MYLTTRTLITHRQTVKIVNDTAPPETQKQTTKNRTKNNSNIKLK